MTSIENGRQDLAEIVAAIQAGCPKGQERLYNVFSRGMRLLISRKVDPQDVEDVLHASFMAVVVAIRSNKINRSEALISFARTIVNRQICAAISRYVRQRTQDTEIGSEIGVADYRTPEVDYIKGEQRERVRKCIEQLRPSDREILYRFYVLEQSKEQICRDLKLTETSFRLAKSRAKAKLTHKASVATPVFPRALKANTLAHAAA